MVECKICLLHFDSENLRPMVGSCGHTVCNVCLLQIGAQCSICRRSSFENPSVNFHLLELVETEKNKLTTGIEEKLASLEEKFEKRLNDNLDKMMCFMSEKVERIEEKMSLMMIEKTHCVNQINTKIENLEENLNGKMDLIYDSLSEIKKYVKNDETASVDLANEAFISEEAETKYEAIDENLEVDEVDAATLLQETSPVTVSLMKRLFELKPPECFTDLSKTDLHIVSSSPDIVGHLDRQCTAERRTIRRCWICNSVLPENLRVRHDGVSVKCECGAHNIIVPLKQGFKWMKTICTIGNHFHQWPLAQNCFQMQKCPVCRDHGPLFDANKYEAEVYHYSPTVQH